VRVAVLAAACALGCFLLAAPPAHAEQAADPLAALIVAGAPLVHSAPPVSTTAGVAHPPGLAASSRDAPPPGPGTAPAVELPAIPNPLDLLGGASLDPRAWAGAFLDAAFDALGGALLGAMRGFTDWALGLGGSSLNFVTRTPEAGSYGSTTVRSLWELSRGVANAGLAVIVMWGGFNVILRQQLRSPYDGVMELLPRVAPGGECRAQAGCGSGSRWDDVARVRGRAGQAIARPARRAPTGAYWATPVRRVEIPKPDGGTRPPKKITCTCASPVGGL